MIIKYLLSTILLALINFSIVFSQEGSILFGKITDKTTGEALIAANVVIKGTSRGTATELNGSYKIVNLKPGNYTIEVTYLGYKTTVITSVKIGKEQRKRLNIKLESTALTIDQEVVIVVERPLVDVEQSNTQSRISSERIEAAPVRQLSQILNTQAGVINSPSGLRIRGGKTYETGFYIDGVSAKDPLAGTGFGVDIGSNSIEELEVSTGSIDVEYGNSTSEIVNTRTKTGGNRTEVGLSYKRDNLGFNEDWEMVFNQQVCQFSIGGPSRLMNFLIPGKGKFKYLY